MMQPKTSVTHYGALKTSGPHYEGRKNLREKFWLWDFKFFFGYTDCFLFRRLHLKKVLRIFHKKKILKHI